MLVLLESRKEKVAAQREFNRLAKAALGSSQRRRIVWRPSSREVDIAHDGAYWFVSVPPEQSQQTPRYWNSFGIHLPLPSVKWGKSHQSVSLVFSLIVIGKCHSALNILCLTISWVFDQDIVFIKPNHSKPSSRTPMARQQRPTSNKSQSSWAHGHSFQGTRLLCFEYCFRWISCPMR